MCKMGPEEIDVNIQGRKLKKRHEWGKSFLNKTKQKLVMEHDFTIVGQNLKGKA